MNLISVKLKDCCNKITAAAGFLCFLYLTLYACRYSVYIFVYENLADRHDNIIAALLCAAVIMAVAAGLKYLGKYIKKNLLLVAAVIFSVGFSILSLKIVNDANAWTAGDQGYVYLASVDMANGVYDSVAADSYFQMYPHQLYFAELMSLVLKASGNTEAGQVFRFQAILAGFIVFGVYLAARALWDDRAHEILSLVSALCFAPIALYSLYFYGETVGTFCAVYAVLFFVKLYKSDKLHKKIIYSALMTVCLVLMFIARSGLIVIMIAMVITALLELLGKGKKRLLAGVLAAVIILIVVRNIWGSHLEKLTGIDMDSGMPAILWVTMGLHDADNDNGGPGCWNGYNNHLFQESGYDCDVAKKQAYSDLNVRLEELLISPGEMIAFFSRKALIQWNEPTYGVFVHTRHMDCPEEVILDLYEGELNDTVWNMLNLMQTMLYAGICIMFGDMVIHKRSSCEYLLCLTALGAFLFSLLWESKSRYIYPYIVILLPCAVRGFFILTDLAGTIFKFAINTINKRKEKMKCLK
jgi:hypothetical protein